MTSMRRLHQVITGALVAVYLLKGAPVHAQMGAGTVDQARAARDRSEAVSDRPASSDSAPGPFGMEVGLGYALFQGQPGLWLEALALGTFDMSVRTRFVAAGGPILTAVSRERTLDFDGDHDLETTQDDSLGLGVAARGHVQHQLSGWLSGRLGLAVGVAHIALDSTECGEAGLTAPFYGVSGGPVFPLGRHLESAITVEFMNYPILRCSNGGQNPVTGASPWRKVHRRDEITFDDPTLAFAARLTYRF